MGKTEHMASAADFATEALANAGRGVMGDEEVRKEMNQTVTEGPESNGIPNRLSMLRSSPYFTTAGAFFGVKLNGVEVPHVVEFNVNAGWIKVGSPGPDGKVTLAAAMNPETRLGKVETFWKMQPSRQVRRQFARML